MKLDKRKLLGPLFKPLSKIKHSRASRILVAMTWLPSQILRAHYNRPFFAVDISSSKGMGAVLTEALLMCQYAEENELIPKIISTNPLYASNVGCDFISLYLGLAEQSELPSLCYMRFRTLWSFYHLKFTDHLSITLANRLFWTYFAPRPVILDKVDNVLMNIPDHKFSLSIHYRGTDKALEAPLVHFELYEKAVHNHQLGGGSIQSIFLATDDENFETFVRQRFPHTQFTTYNLGTSVDTSRGRHFSNMSPEDKAIESLVNMFLLAAAPTCIRGASYMSAISKILNPELQTITLNRTHWGSSGFPELEILAEEDIALNLAHQLGAL